MLIMTIIKYDGFTMDSKLQILRKLFGMVSDINFGDTEETNPLIMICYINDISVVQKFNLIKFLVEEIKVDINKLSNNNKSAIMYVYQKCQIELVNYFLSKGAKIKYTLADGKICAIVDGCYRNHNCYACCYGELMSLLIDFYSKNIEGTKSGTICSTDNP